MPNMLKLVASNAVKPNGINTIKFLNKDKDKDKISKFEVAFKIIKKQPKCQKNNNN